jgi:hypothetical protein
MCKPRKYICAQNAADDVTKMRDVVHIRQCGGN